MRYSTVKNAEMNIHEIKNWPLFIFLGTFDQSKPHWLKSHV